jgi:photosystem II stability/assembly factor-like uncharacterized protein
MPRSRVHLASLCLAVLVASAGIGALPAREGPDKEKRKNDTGQAAPTAAVRLGEPALAALKARSIGPAVMGGRVSDIALDPLDPAVFYVGFATSGVWKTTDSGSTFSTLFDKQPALSIGAVALAPSDPRVVWVGTGEANDRNSSGWGRGVFRSTDGGETWTAAGLERSRAIARIVVDPRDPEVAFVAAMGDLWAPGGERGLYKTADGGRSWSLVLAAPRPHDATTGCGDVALDPQHPDTLYATLYARQRKPWRFEYGIEVTGGRDVGGIYKSTDAGASWRKLAGGLPGKTGRIGLAVFPADPRIVYAIVQSDEGGTSAIGDIHSKRGGVFRSEDGGETWTRMNRLNPRAFYFSQIRVDPIRDERVYVLGFMLHVSDDGGRTFREDLFGKVHPDCHALAITALPEPLVERERRLAAERRDDAAPRPPPVSRRLVLGTDGGVYHSLDGGASWAHLDQIPAGQFYRIQVDDSTPYRICGGLQDNTNWVGPSRTYTKEGIRNAEWTMVGGGDGFYCVFDPEDRNVVYAESQEGYLHRFDLGTGELKELRPSPTEGQPEFRFHWNSPLVGSRHAPGTLYLAGNRVFRLTSRAEHWDPISPDLSARDPDKTTATGSGAENYGVVYTLAESPVVPGMLWAGTDDGKLWVTRDGGRAWTELTAKLPAPVRGQWLGRIEPSWHDPDVAYLAVAAYRAGNHAPLVFLTADRGERWRSVAGNLPGDTPVHVLREDPRNPSVLYAGTEFGLYVSLDGGGAWTWFGDLPAVRVDDLVVHPRERDLVIGTHGRSLYVIDDLTAVEELTPHLAQEPLALFPPRPAYGQYLLPGWVDWNGAAVYRGENPSEGAILTLWVREFTGEPVKVSITNALGQPVANLTAAGTPGLNRLSWDLRPTKDVLTEYGGQGPQKLVPSGEYTVTATRGKDKAQQKLAVTIAPGIETR